MFTGINLWRTSPLTSFNTITGELPNLLPFLHPDFVPPFVANSSCLSDDYATSLAFPLDPRKYEKLSSEDSVPEIEDVPISLVNAVVLIFQPHNISPD